MQKKSDPLHSELKVLDTLLRDKAFARSMAAHLDSSYHAGLGQTAPPFLSASDDTASVPMSKKEEKIATNLAGFYALECGVEALCAKTGETPVAWLERIAANTVDSATALLLNRFANATWKAGQPFRALERITRYNFTGAGFLSKEEVEKDAVQIRNAAAKLLSSLHGVKNAALSQQMEALKTLLQSEAYATEMAAYLDSAFAVSQGQKPTPFLSADEDTAVHRKPVKEIKIATNLAGFYALECGVNYLATAQNLLPSAVLQSLVAGSLPKEDQALFARFANATWKAGQPFRGLQRISRETFTPFYFLTEADVEKDLVQVKAAAKKVLPQVKQ